MAGPTHSLVYVGNVLLAFVFAVKGTWFIGVVVALSLSVVFKNVPLPEWRIETTITPLGKVVTKISTLAETLIIADFNISELTSASPAEFDAEIHEEIQNYFKNNTLVFVDNEDDMHVVPLSFFNDPVFLAAWRTHSVSNTTLKGSFTDEDIAHRICVA
jgi:hypothetical protein